MPFALMEILPRFGWTKSPNAARGERWVDCSLFFVVALLVISSLLLDLPRFAKAFALIVVLMRDMTDFPPPPLLVFVTSVLDGGLLFSMAKPAVLTLPPTYALSSVAALEFFLDEVLRTRCGEASFDRLPLLRRCCCWWWSSSLESSESERLESSSELDAYSLSFGKNIGSMLLSPVPTLPM